MRAEEVKFCPKCGQPVMLEFRFAQDRPVCTVCGFIYFADPKVAVALMLEREGKILLVRRAHDPFRGLWTLPGALLTAAKTPPKRHSVNAWRKLVSPLKSPVF